MQKCFNCDKETRNKKYCSRECYLMYIKNFGISDKHYQALCKGKLEYFKNNPSKIVCQCLICGKEFIRTKSCIGKFCSNNCKNIATSRGIIENKGIFKVNHPYIGHAAKFEKRICVYCGNFFEINKIYDYKFCSLKCYYLSKSNGFYPQAGFQKREKHFNWLGGISKLPYPFGFDKNLSQKIRCRDNYTCQLCNISERKDHYKLSIHHINHDKGDLNETNLISLCKSCNTKVNYNQEQWKNYFINKMETLYASIRCYLVV